jgi:hypothetical protein
MQRELKAFVTLAGATEAVVNSVILWGHSICPMASHIAVWRDYERDKLVCVAYFPAVLPIRGAG